MRQPVRSAARFSVGLLLLSGCSDPASLQANPTSSASSVASTGSSSSSGTGGDLGISTGSGEGGGSSTGGGGGAAPGPACGDKAVDPGEACDDGNGDSGDGCSGNCDAIENGFACPVPGELCVSTVHCGDGKIGGDETCDDQNDAAGDGCDASCHVEPGWACVVLGAACQAALCGDGIVAGSEDCEDDNAAPADGDGCDASCHLEPGFKCDVAGDACVPTVCGDGVREGSEQCDDANNDMGDGCTPFCVREPDCTLGACTSTCGDGIKLPGLAEACEDGNTKDGDGCSATCQIEPGFVCDDVIAAPSELVLPIVLRDFLISHPDMEYVVGTDKNMVSPTLGLDGKPVYANASGTTPTTTGQSAFDQWYRDVPGVNSTVVQTISLGELPTGEFQFSDASFFPLDGIGFGNEGNGHNFHFTSEVRYWFEYKGGEQLDFTGDDDVWVFVNKQLAIDLGGVHGAQSAGVTLDAVKAEALGLEIGKIYEIVVFQAERHTTQSNYKLTLSDFSSSSSHCHSVCGDGIKTPDEACDDGVNDGSYGSCTPDCQWGPYCGDGMLQDAEECDDGANLSPYGGCAPGCVLGATCGDGKVDSLFGEQCDDGQNDGGYDQCAQGCVLGDRCGDGKVQAGEECDDGNVLNGDGCDADCTIVTAK